MQTILAYGTRVRLVNPDMFGLQGRDLHPEPEDVGFTGVITRNTVESDCRSRRDVEPETLIDDDVTLVYEVMAANGRCLELASYEVEVCNT